MEKDITETKICVQKILPYHQTEFNEIHSSGKDPEHIAKLQAAFFTKKIWPKGSKITIGFLDNGDNIQRNNLSNSNNLDPLQNEVDQLSVQEAVKKVVTERIKPLVNLDISFVDNAEQANVRISFDPNGGAWSLVGTDHLGQTSGATMNLGWFDVPTTIHEFGHVLGMIHEHQNPYGQTIMWNETKVLEWAKETQGWNEETTNENIIKKYDKNSIKGSNFDPLSIMLYFFPSDLTLNNTGTKQNFRLSSEDVIWIDRVYHNDNGISPSTFYEDTYGIPLDVSTDNSNKNFNQFTNQKKSTFSINWKTILLIIAIIIFFVTIIVLFLHFKYLKNKKLKLI